MLVGLLQALSSDPFEQSAVPSQTQVSGKHFLDFSSMQVNWSGVHVKLPVNKQEKHLKIRIYSPSIHFAHHAHSFPKILKRTAVL